MKPYICRFYKDKITVNILFFALIISSCKRFVEVNPPVTSTTSVSVYSADGTAIAALTGIYTKMSQGSFATGKTSISFFSGLSADEFILYSGVTNTSYIAYYKNALSNNVAGYELWQNLYPFVYACNSAIEGLNASTSITPIVKQQLLGESKFLRSFYYFYLVNLYGDLPLSLTTDYTLNASLERTPKAQVYQQIIQDLTNAKSLLVDGFIKSDVMTLYTSGSAERVRPNKSAATALLARAFLYTGDWAQAEEQASIIIANTNYYALTSLNKVFLKNSSEAIWQLQPVATGVNTLDASLFTLPSTGPSVSVNPVYLSNTLLSSFEPSDQRKINTNWVTSVTVNGNIYYYPYKYQANTFPTVNNVYPPPTEYLMVLRLAEQYLIRAEARTRQGNVTGAQSDLNVIRNRAGLSPTTATTQATLLTAIQHERQVELFSEWGHRWLDLKRTGTVDGVMTVETNQKGGTWNSYQQLYPIYSVDIQRDPGLTQNQGY